MNQKREAGLEVEALRARIIQELTFSPRPAGDGTVCANPARPELGHLMLYESPDLYAFAVADYTIAHDFTLPFHHSDLFMRFGIFWEGVTHTEMSGGTRLNTASAFFCIEHNISGTQTWRKGQHFHGIEVMLYPEFFDRFIYPLWPDAVKFPEFTENEVYHYLPDDLLHLLEHLNRLAVTRALSRMHLEALLISCAAVLTQAVHSEKGSIFARQTDIKVVPLGPNRSLRLTASDIAAICLAHDILHSEAASPPSLEALSKRVYLGEQKLKFGFAFIYHQSISQYVNAVRMARASTLLTTTDLSVETIAREIGFNHSGNFSRKFKETYHMTPLAFRKNKAQGH